MANDFREKLEKLGNEKRFTFEGVFKRMGFKHTYTKEKPIYLPTLVLAHVKCDGEEMTDHLWINYTKGFGKLGELKEGDVIQFDGRISSYTKGYYADPKKVDYDVERPTKVKLLNRDVVPNSLPDPLDEKNALIGYVMKVNKDFYKANNRPYDTWYVQEYEEWEKEHETREA